MRAWDYWRANRVTAGLQDQLRNFVINYGGQGECYDMFPSHSAQSAAGKGKLSSPLATLTLATVFTMATLRWH